ncbi:FUSC family protein [Vibrio marisflavi]|uniref:p-hydroxybenzoic acid efflux pump subunit AaeB n=1 Tax=Vibrio marisflavi CECT 7928 TaxID=634439 RepID=A0ABN8E2R7_9VIBR|nr:FUSC family protein [Vibrio marisflavi]CAH0539467.1 p-hydroxybenzoic acid efflux pump subunit AaeB [Vibrio marisflavi CECT 7928]
MLSQAKQYLHGHQQLVHALRITLALAFTLLFYHVTQLPHSLWGPITVSVVMNQPQHGALLHKGLQRIIGTTLGATVGLVTVLFPTHLPLIAPLWMLLGVFLLSLRMQGKYHYLFFLAVMTLLIVGYQESADVEVSVALWRVANIMIGTAIAILFSQLFPIHTSTIWRQLQHKVLTNLRTLYLAHASSQLPSNEHLYQLRRKVITDHVKMSGLMANLQKEKPSHIEKFQQYLQSQRALIALIEQLVDTHWSTEISHQKLIESTELKYVLDSIGTTFEKLERCDLNTIDLPKIADVVSIAKNLMKIDDPEKETFKLGPYGYLWLTRQLIVNLDNLVKHKLALDKLRYYERESV